MFRVRASLITLLQVLETCMLTGLLGAGVFYGLFYVLLR